MLYEISTTFLNIFKGCKEPRGLILAIRTQTLHTALLYGVHFNAIETHAFMQSHIFTTIDNQ